MNNQLFYDVLVSGVVTPEVIKGVEKRVFSSPPRELTELERIALYFYTDTGYEELNQQLRNKRVNEQVGIFHKYLTSALGRLPFYKGKCLRGTESKYLEQLDVGAIVDFECYISATKLNTLPEPFGDSSALLVISSKTGRSISAFSKYKDSEDEILFSFGTKFVVLKADTTSKPVQYELIEY